VASNCWICEGWSRMQFKFAKSKALGSSGPDPKRKGE
jgi:hypothetical protein